MKKSDIMKMPNKLNIFERGSSLYGRGVPFFAALNFLEFGKNAKSAKLGVAKGFFLGRFQLVWRQWEFVFFGALTTVGALFIFERMKKCLKMLVGKLKVWQRYF